MEKKQVAKFLIDKKRGIYGFIVEMYADTVTSMALALALEVIREDLQKESNSKVELSYFAFAKAVRKFKKSNASKSVPAESKWRFSDANEHKSSVPIPGKFKLVK